MSGPKFPLYSIVNCISEREHLSVLNGNRVAIVAHSQCSDGSWEYSITDQTKAALAHKCIESELRPAEPCDAFADKRSFLIIRQMLETHLHPGYDVEFESLPDAIIAAIKHSNLEELVDALMKLSMQTDAIVEEVLGDHSLYLWERTTPREFLVMLKVLASLK